MIQLPNNVSQALDEVLSQFGERLRRAARRRGLAEHDIDELLQDVRIRLWRALETGEKISSVTASYVYRAARSATVDLIRRRRGYRESSLSETTEAGEPTLAASEAPSPLDNAGRQDVLRQLESAVAGLAESRAAVVRMYLAGFHREEIAGQLGWTEAKTRNLLYRGLADLRARLEEWGIGPGSAA